MTAWPPHPLQEQHWAVATTVPRRSAMPAQGWLSLACSLTTGSLGPKEGTEAAQPGGLGFPTRLQSVPAGARRGPVWRLCTARAPGSGTEGLGGGAEAREAPASLARGYRPGWGPEPALTSARRRRPAAGSTPPRPWCSPAGCWPEAQRWRRDLMGKAESRLLGGKGNGQPAGTPLPEPRGRLDRVPDAHAVQPDVSAQAGLKTARLSALPRLGPDPHLVRFSHQSRSLHPSVCPASSLPVPGGGRARKQVPWWGCGVGASTGHPRPCGSRIWTVWVVGSGRTGHVHLHQALQVTDLADARPGP